MSERNKDIVGVNQNHGVKVDHERNNQQLTARICKLNALTFNNLTCDDFDLDKAMSQSEGDLMALGATEELQEMLASQLLSIHQLQQSSIAIANKMLLREDARYYYINAAIKLTNCFTQQANLLSKLQGNGAQRIVVERVDVHNGGQAIVGNVNGGSVKK